MTLPTLPKPYEKLEELIANNFTLYQPVGHLTNLEWILREVSPPTISERMKNLLLKNLIKIESHLDMKFLSACNENQGIALFEPEGLAFIHADELRRQAHIDWEDVNVGIESYAGVWRGLKVVNNVDPSINKRTSYIFEAGITNQWIGMWSLRMFLQRKPDRLHWIQSEFQRKLIEWKLKVKDSSSRLVLNSNVLALFVFLSIGYVVALCCFLVEHLVRFVVGCYIVNLFNKLFFVLLN